MSNKRCKQSLRPVLVTALTLVLAANALTHAQSGGGYDLTWFTTDGGGDTSTGGNYTLSGTAGQPDAGKLSGGDYTLVGGFWGTAGYSSVGRYPIYLPLVLRH